MKKSCFILSILVFIAPSCMSRFASNIISLQPRELPLAFLGHPELLAKIFSAFVCLKFLLCIRLFKWYFCWIQNSFLKLFIFGCVVSSLLHTGFLQLGRVRAILRRGVRASHCNGFSCCGARALGMRASVVVAHGLQWLWHMGSVVVDRGLQSTGSVVVAHGLTCSAACGIFPDQGSNPCPLHWQADSLTTAPPGKSWIQNSRLIAFIGFFSTLKMSFYYVLASFILAEKSVLLKCNVSFFSVYF